MTGAIKVSARRLSDIDRAGDGNRGVEVFIMGPGKTEALSVSLDLLRSGRSGALSTLSKKDGGWPYGSLVTFATDLDGSPIFLLSALSDHTRNLAGDARASLLIENTSNRVKPQTGPRVTLMGVIGKSRTPRHRKRFLARHPAAAMYAGFGDFAFYKMTLERGHFVGGFARAVRFQGRDLMTPAKTAKVLAEAEPGLLEHMNSDHADAVDLYANALLRRKGKGWRMAAIDATGADLIRNGRIARLKFANPVTDSSQIRDELVRLAGLARVSHTKMS